MLSPRDAENAYAAVLAGLQDIALIRGDFTLSSGQPAKYYVDVKRLLLTGSAPHRELGQLVATEAHEAGATAIGGLVHGAVPVALAPVYHDSSFNAFFVRQEE